MLPIIMNLTFNDSEDESNFIELVENYWNTMVKVADKILGNRADAEDAAQDAFIKLYLRFSKYRKYSTKSQITLLYKMTKNSAIDLYRKNAARSNSDIRFDMRLDVLSTTSKEDIGLIEAMNLLSEDDRDLLMLRYFYEYSIRDLAKLYGIAENSVYKKIERARARLDLALKEARNE
ncbi:MAG: sigma-70 family RNA polymerase sigma factor [Firmicutes bacterium]|nr:sigma-70 family RNA polymerase sigma factor [Bacillota bacterium]